ncbi:DNA-binding transcriptional regulator, MarR family [Streptoalloteichus tenebrarius]|uniref:DNA-binding transcriptional regulator, MarR family n=1 Tax=Streptoalloteichus tenebrarius (strain ATCC 17920 / DSM 40477 / JCM 4838 / CBS 697.72 / NBRC 16177 / NCIMB 11028 / NRRL B-12390 / A12253. 1 / ISP 5477) TaxID=1933 RepID=A0ABT1HWV7_STRSD|nr:MarR family transcriptional regulator [Streptoalloteichus tenebrarius]MCP2259984.1 DNA-binding transcriptional regulator, MarR family [Streptoalloteichus tenebrarius]BFF03903.1 MarR family transcriptional regulator [Streptoalloteichus tenebrarius]
MADAVDLVIGAWREERPDLADDLWPVGIVGRVQRLSRVFDRELKTFYAKRGLENWEFDVLTTLRRSRPPYELTAGGLLKATMVTSGAITNRIDRLEAKGLVERVRDTVDRRSVRIRLTERGHQVVDEVFGEHLKNEARFLPDMDEEEYERFTGTLRRLLEHFGDTSLT